MSCLATVIVPTFDHGPTIRYALASALRQTVRDLEVFIIGDGVGDENRQLLIELAASDRRVRFIDHPKHERRGEPYRHQALAEARGRIVCYLCDRDLWLPCHVERMLKQLESADFTHSLSLHVLPDQKYRFFPTDLAIPEHRQYMTDVANRVALSCAAHTMDLYRRLPFGWRTTPADIVTDWYMFQQFLRMEGCRASSGTYPSAITLPSPPRYGFSIAQRVAELESWAARLADESTRASLVSEILQEAIRARELTLAAGMREAAGLQASLASVRQTVLDFESSPLWRFRSALLRIPVVARLARAAARMSRGTRSSRPPAGSSS